MENKMNFLSLASKRYSVRKYSDRKVERELIMKALEAARLAPSACNAQPWHFIVVDDRERVKKLAEATFLPLSKLNKFVTEAPVIIAVVSESPNISSAVGGYIKKNPITLWMWEWRLNISVCRLRRMDLEPVSSDGLTKRR